MPRHLLTSTPPSPADPRQAADTDHSPRHDSTTPGYRSARGPVRGRRALLGLFALLLVAWVAIAGIGGPYFGKISEVSTNDRSSFLPESAESTRAQAQIEEFTDLDYVPAIVVLEREAGVTDADASALADLVERLDAEGLLAASASPAIPSEDGEALELILPVSAETTADDVEQIRAVIAEETSGTGTGADVSVHVTGPAGFAADLSAAFAGIDGILLLVALAAVFVILVVVYRSPLLPVIVLFTSIAALSASIFVIWHLADAGILLINGQVQGILFILVVGATTDYSLLVVARFRDTLLTERDRVRAGLSAVKGVVEPIAASGGTVIASLLVLLLTDLASTRALGPVAAIGILTAMLAALTFLPAALISIGRGVFWPFLPRAEARPAGPGSRASAGSHDVPAGTRAGGAASVRRGLWARVAEVVAQRPRAIWIGLVIVLALPLLAFPQFRASGVAQSEFVLGESEARDGQEVLAEHFPGGSGSPTQIIVAESELEEAAQAVGRLGGVESMAVTMRESPSGTAEVDEDGTIQLPDLGGGPTGPTVPPQPTTVDGNVLLEVTLTDAADSLAAEETVRAIRDAVHEVDAEALVGGETAVDLDTNTTAEADRALAIPLILLVITIILIALLRSLVAPLLLVALTVLSFGTALGVSALVFNDLLDFPGADPSVPLYAFVFLVALGIDYNIFLMSRVREESLQVGTRKGVISGLVATGGVITSAGIVLAATFAALAVIPIMFLVQLAFIVTFGVLLDAILVRSLVVPALVHDIGRSVWWPWQNRIPRD
ncbi:RND superfamily putative drug exporter [Brevibacterium sanguinis]|uniref:RND superfamily putative drug exporter n=2 Tax=Brevibacterium TaxID=1696 RepID=A0A366IJ90_9MICO|nr:MULTISPECIES: MMPL family transporter [Brevibacterium]RBP64946.1 RND superfamily putative drug exporter [Brevibacterium sanguinis]RBP71209.1 RND superfamily putative drug exporter [Brevibacterium celere]